MKLWIGFSKWAGGYEGDHTEIVVSDSKLEATEKIFDMLYEDDITLINWDGVTWNMEKFLEEGCEYFGNEGVIIVKEMEMGKLKTFTPG